MDEAVELEERKIGFSHAHSMSHDVPRDCVRISPMRWMRDWLQAVNE